MNKDKLQSNFNSENINNNSIPKIIKSQVKKDEKEKSKRNNFEDENEKNKSCYKTPFNSKNNEDVSYSKMEMPISYQLTNGRCIRIRHSPISKTFYDFENENIINNTSRKKESKSSNSSIINNSIFVNKNEKVYSLSKDNNSLISYGKSNYIYPMKFIKHHQKKLFKEESQKVMQNVDTEIKTYKKYNLMINPSYKYNKRFISSPIHKYLPYCKKNDEVYKKNLISYIRHEVPLLNRGVKSVSGTFAEYINNNHNEKPQEKDIHFFLLKKKKKIYSTKKVFVAEKNLYKYYLIDGKNKVDYQNPIKFKFYFDNDIGFNFLWQSPLIIANGDDDVETDDEVLSMAEEKCMDDLVEGINTWNKSSRICRNFILAKKLNNIIVKTPTFHNVTLDKEKINDENKYNKEEVSKNIYNTHKSDNVSFGK